MRQGNNRRGRHPKGQKQGTIPTRNQVFDSNGPEVRVRGNAHQVFDKYSALAREASAAGNHVQAEAYYQFAEHYLRIHLAATVMGGGNRRGGPAKDQFPPEAMEDPLIFRPDMPEPQERNEQQARDDNDGEGNGGERKERRERNRDRGERGDRDDRRRGRDRKPRNQRADNENNESNGSVDPSEQDQPEIPLFHAGMDAPEGEAIVESRVPKPVPAPPPMDDAEPDSADS